MESSIRHKGIFLVLPILFTFEMIFGYTGTMLMIGRLAIRHILFLGSFISLYGMLFYYLIKNKYNIFKSLSMIDWSLALVILSTLFSMTFAPKLTGGNMDLAFDEMLDSVATLSLFFPIAFFIKVKEINFNRYKKILSFMVFGLSLLHVILYIGQVYNNNFIASYFDLYTKLCFGTSITPRIILGHGGYTRVIFTTSILILLGIYVSLSNIDKMKKYDYVSICIGVTAILTTMTKSIWLGLVCGYAVFALGYVILQIRNKNKKNILKIVLLTSGIILLVTILNYLVFSNMVFIRFNNTFVNSYSTNRISSEESTSSYYKDENYMLDEKGAIISNDIKINQIGALIGKWKQHPILGNGYGSYAENNIRSKEAPFSYEMTAFSMLMKIGILGMSTWILFLLSLIITLWRCTLKNRVAFVSWLFIFISFGLAIQTNPLFFSFTGMSIMLFIAIETVNISSQKLED